MSDLWRQAADAWLVEHQTVDMPAPALTSLRAAEQFILCNIRLWWNVTPTHKGEDTAARTFVREGFASINLPLTAREGFERFLLILKTAAVQIPHINGISCAEVSDDETRLLSLISLCQQGHNGHALMVLKRWLPPTAYRVSLENAVRFASGAAEQGLILPARLKLPVRDTDARPLLH